MSRLSIVLCKTTLLVLIHNLHLAAIYAILIKIVEVEEIDCKSVVRERCVEVDISNFFLKIIKILVAYMLYCWQIRGCLDIVVEQHAHKNIFTLHHIYNRVEQITNIKCDFKGVIL